MGSCRFFGLDEEEVGKVWVWGCLGSGNWEERGGNLCGFWGICDGIRQ